MSEESQDHWNYWSHQTGANTLEAFLFGEAFYGTQAGSSASTLAYTGQFPHRTSELKIKRTGKVGAIPENLDSIPCTHAGAYNHL